MENNLRTQDIFAYYRLALTTGLEEKEAPVLWAEREILRTDIPSHELIELALAGRQPYSQIIYMLSDFVAAKRDYTLALKLLLARAGVLFEQDPEQAIEILQGLRLLLAEPRLPHEVKTGLVQLDQGLERYRQGTLEPDSLKQMLNELLSQYSEYRPLLMEFD